MMLVLPMQVIYQGRQTVHLPLLGEALVVGAGQEDLRVVLGGDNI